jgi:probable HAF family extracellular repeat protein
MIISASDCFLFNHRTRLAKFCASLLLAVFATNAQAATPSAYLLTDLGLLPGGTVSYGYGINSEGQVTGLANSSGKGSEAYVYSGGTMRTIGTLGDSSTGIAINDNRQVTGFYAVSGIQHAFIYSGGVMQDLGISTEGLGYGITSSGVVAGTYYPAGSDDFHAFIYNNSVLTDLGTLRGGLASEGLAINASNHVAGYSDFAGANQQHHAYLYSGGVMHDLRTLGGFGDSEAFGINNADQVTGQTTTNASGVYDHAFLYSGGLMHDLGTLGGLTSRGNGICSNGSVVGDSLTATGQDDAFLYRGGVMMDLNSLISPSSGLLLESAVAINDSGQITGWGTTNGQIHAFLLTPVPEPSTFILGALALGMLLRKRLF